jgi:hypothetical protein
MKRYPSLNVGSTLLHIADYLLVYSISRVIRIILSIFDTKIILLIPLIIHHTHLYLLS